MKETIATITVFVVVGALIWNQLPSDDNTIVIDEYKEDVSTWLDAGPEIPSSNAYPEISDTADEVIEGPFDEKFALARQILGSDGLFTWQGKEYTCLYREELDASLNEDTNDSIDDSTINHSEQIVESID